MARNGPEPSRRESSRAKRLLAACVVMALAVAGTALGDSGSRIVHTIDFTDKTHGNAAAWLRDEGYTLRMDAKDLNPRFTDQGLILSTEGETTGLFAREMTLPDADAIRVTWGVERYPEGADWEEGVYRVPIAVMISYGKDKLGSGSVFAPNLPYFVSLFLSENAQPGKFYTAKYYQKGGRYFCDPCTPPVGETVTTSFDLVEGFREAFGKSDVPPISGFSFQMNTKDTAGGAEAFIKRVEFVSQ